jgi:hypothetical protein
MAVVSTAQIPGFVRQLKQAHVDLVKGYVGLSEPMLDALVRAAAAELLRVVMDAWGRNGTAVVAGTGIAAFAHLGTVPITDETVALMHERPIASITTLAVFEYASRRRLADLGLLRQPLLRESMPPAFVSDLTAFAIACSLARRAGVCSWRWPMRSACSTPVSSWRLERVLRTRATSTAKACTVSWNSSLKQV